MEGEPGRKDAEHSGVDITSKTTYEAHEHSYILCAKLLMAQLICMVLQMLNMPAVILWVCLYLAILKISSS